MDDTARLLFESKAIEICPEEMPFWYTSGKIGPYYINTHFLYGDKNSANRLLDIINKAKEDKNTCSKVILDELLKNYNENMIYKKVIDSMKYFINEKIDLNTVDGISGGERRDWFFSLILAKLFDLPHITIFKDMEAIVFYNGKSKEESDYKGKKFLHIVDLINEASSFERAWIKKKKKKNGKILWNASVVDRNQGGTQYLESRGIHTYSLFSVKRELFEMALREGMISKGQFDLIKLYIENPEDTMKEFLLKNSSFIRQSLSKDAKTRERVQIFLKNNVYNLEEKYINSFNYTE